MSDIYYALIIFPIIFMVVLAFIFSSSLTEVNAQQFKVNCPFPIYDGIASNVNINGVNVEYDVTYGNGTDNSGTFFDCTNTGELLGVSTTVKDYGATFFDTIPYGWLGYTADSIGAFFQKIIAFGTLLYLFINAPAEVTDLSFFSYINLVLGGFIGLGAFMIVRGN